MRSSITMIVFLVLVGCDNANGGGDESTTPIMKVSKSTEIAKAKENRTEWTIVEMDLDDMPFGEAFRVQREGKGPGHVFHWRGSDYTTDYETIRMGYHKAGFNDGHTQWVRNSDDMDDHCRSNSWDKCGVCDGNGPFTWYLDRDGDGLGDINESTEACNYPSVDEEE